MRAAAAAGALVSVNHPKPFGPAWEYPSATGYHAIEVWNGAWERLNHVALAWWEQHLRAGRRVVALGGSDTHNLREIDLDTRHGRKLGVPTTWARVDGPAAPDTVLGALSAGRVFISRDVDGPQLYIWRVDDGVALRAVDAPGAALVLVSARGIEATVAITGSDWKQTFHQPHGRGYLRAQLMDEHGQMLALTNPLFD
jgi:hypothetical protein